MGLQIGDGVGSLEDAEELTLTHDDVLDVLDFDLRAGILAVHDSVTLGDRRLDSLAVIQSLSRTTGHDLALHRFFLG